MPPLPRRTLLARTLLPQLRPTQTFRISAKRRLHVDPTPQPAAPEPNAHRSFWLSFGRPIAKVFLLAMATYQLSYLAWAKMASIEEEREGDGEIGRLEARLRQLDGRVERAATEVGKREGR
ncbi:hypothetical protein ANO11243_004040 [Dothideomycetidae sp. 11243]|nr:hypothetical protein ANO11243_004040 [fungal sp. No.11243]